MSLQRADPAYAIAALYPDLVRLARSELIRRHLDRQLAEDVVGDAVVRWLTSRIQYTSPARTRAWFRVTIRHLAVDRVRRPGRDAMDQGEVWSLDAAWSTRGA